jgi:hypothetical protein
MTEPTPQPVFVARKTFMTSIDGKRITVRKDKTRVAADHELVTRHPDLFRQAGDGLAFGVVTREDKPAPTPEPAPVDAKAVRAWATENGIDVPKRGKIADAVVEAYAVAHATPEPTPQPAPEPAPDAEAQES